MKTFFIQSHKAHRNGPQCKSIGPTHQKSSNSSFLSNESFKNHFLSSQSHGKRSQISQKKTLSSIDMVFKAGQCEQLRRIKRKKIIKRGENAWTECNESNSIHYEKRIVSETVLFGKQPINSQQIKDKQKIIAFFKDHVFDETLKFRRFSNLLKQRYLFNAEKKSIVNTTNNEKKGCMSEDYISKENRLMLIKERQDKSKLQNQSCVAQLQSFSPKIRLKKRPSSGIPLKKNKVNLHARKRKGSFKVNCNKSLQLKHIEALCYEDGSYSLKLNRRTENKSCSFIWSRKRTQSISEGLAKMSHHQTGIQINPWESQQDRIKNISDIQVCVKLNY